MLATVALSLGSLVGVLLLVWYAWYWSWYHLYKIRHKDSGAVLHGPPAYFPFGVDPRSHDLRQAQLRFEDYCKEFDDFCQLNILHECCLMVGDLEGLEDVIAEKKFVKRMYPPLFDRYLKKKGILFTNDMESWKVNRTAALHGMMKTKHLRRVVEWSADTAAQLTNIWKEGHGNSLFKVDIDTALTRLALDVIGKAAFGLEINAVGDHDNHLGKLVESVMDTAGPYNFVPPWVFDIYMPKGLREGEKSITELRGVVKSIIAQRRDTLHEAGMQYHDLLDILLSYRDESGKGLDEDDITFTCWDLFLAGHETSAHTMAWALYELAQYPEEQDLLYEEAERILGSTTAGDLTVETVNKLERFHRTVKETLRLHPVVPVFTRKSSETTQVKGYVLPPETPVVIVTYRLHRNPKYWKEPLVFKPNRWEGVSADDLQKLPYKPFGYGPRACLGMRMSLLETKVVLSMLIRHFRFSLPPDHKPPTAISHITMRPVGLELCLQRR